MPRRLRDRARPLRRPATALMLALPAACALEQKMAVEVVDTPLRERGEELRAAKAPRGELRLGPYAITGITHERVKGAAPLLDDAQPRPSTFYGLDFDLRGDGGSWHARCLAERRVSMDIDFAAAADESHDAVAIACTLTDPAARDWSLKASGDVGNGLDGEVVGARPDDVAFTVQVLARRRYLNAVARELPFPVAQLRQEKVAAAAMLLDAPERAWLGPELSVAGRELAVAVLVALRLLPLGEAPMRG
ncbi:MAG: hypothetical protein R3A79_07750 [Nannocystaceae bacterium]